MDSASRQIIKQNEKLIRSLDMNKLVPFLVKYRIFSNSMLKDICKKDSDYDLFSELPTRGPKAFISFLEILEKAGYKNESISMQSTPKFTEYKKKHVFYPMNSNPIGYCLIINNVKFKVLEDRYGSDVDADALLNLFQKIGYSVQTERNLKGEEMQFVLKDFSKRKYLKSVDSCFIVILSHGGNDNGIDVIYGTDSIPVKKSYIYDVFNNKNCENLAMKPKVFLFQACRGKSEDVGVFSRESTDSSNLKKTASLSDILVVHSSLPDHKAYRDHLLGSWFVQDLISVVSENYLYEHFETMLKTVNRKIQDRMSLIGGHKQVLHVENRGLRADLHICSNDDFKGCDINLRNYNVSEE